MLVWACPLLTPEQKCSNRAMTNNGYTKTMAFTGAFVQWSKLRIEDQSIKGKILSSWGYCCGQWAGWWSAKFCFVCCLDFYWWYLLKILYFGHLSVISQQIMKNIHPCTNRKLYCVIIILQLIVGVPRGQMMGCKLNLVATYYTTFNVTVSISCQLVWNWEKTKVYLFQSYQFQW